MFLNESSLEDLYQSAVDAFPRTTKRQHATDPIVITNLHWTPYRGVKTLFIKGLAQNRHEGTEYNCLMLFKNVNYDGKQVKITANDLKEYSFDRLSLLDTDVLLRCNCPDFYWRFNYYDHVDRALYGRVRGPYESKGVRPPANPLELPGMCKHLMKMSKALQEAGIFLEKPL